MMLIDMKSNCSYLNSCCFRENLLASILLQNILCCYILVWLSALSLQTAWVFIKRNAEWKPLQFLTIVFMYRIFEKLKSSEPPVSSTFMVSFAKGVGLLLNLLLYFKLDFSPFSDFLCKFFNWISQMLFGYRTRVRMKGEWCVWENGYLDLLH